jgi:hypothetical protein
MSIKKFFVGMAVLLSVSLFVIGCPTDAGDQGPQGGVGAQGPGTLSGSYTAAGVNDFLSGLTKVYVGNLEITGSGTVDFGSLAVVFSGEVKTDTDGSRGAVYLALSKANVTVVGDPTIDLKGAKDMVQGTVSQREAWGNNVVTGGLGFITVAENETDFNSAEEVTALGGVVAVENYILGVADKLPAGLSLYVFGTLTVNATSAAPTANGTKVTATGKVEVTGTVATGVLTDASKVDVSGAVISAVGTDASVALAATITGYHFDLDDNTKLKVTGTTSIGADVKGNGELTLDAAVTKAVITGKGRIVFDKAPAFETDDSSIATGTTGGYAFFKEGFTSPATDDKALTLDGFVVVATGKTIGFGDDGSSIKLAKGTGLAVGNLAAIASAATFLTANDELELTGEDATAVLTPTGANLAVTTKGITFDGPVDFAGDLTLTAVPATFKGNVSFVEGKKIVLTAATSVVKLAAGKYLGNPGTQPVYSSVIHNTHASNDLTLTPAADTKLTFTNARTITQASSAETAGPHGITIDGTASLPAGATYIVESATGTVGTLTVDASAELLVAAGVLDNGPTEDDKSSTLVLIGAAGTDGALLKGTGTVNAGKTAIVGGTNGWQVVGANSVSIMADTIDASTNAAVLTGVAGGSDAMSITVAAEGTLTIKANTAINLADNGSIVLTKDETAGGTLNLATTTAKIVGLTGGTDNQTFTDTNIANAVYTVGTAAGAINGTATSGAGNGTLAGGTDTGDHLIKAGSSDNATIGADTLIGAN